MRKTVLFCVAGLVTACTQLLGDDFRVQPESTNSSGGGTGGTGGTTEAGGDPCTSCEEFFNSALDGQYVAIEDVCESGAWEAQNFATCICAPCGTDCVGICAGGAGTPSEACVLCAVEKAIGRCGPEYDACLASR